MQTPIVNDIVPPTLEFAENSTMPKEFPYTRPSDDSSIGLTNYKEGIPLDYSLSAQSPLKARIDDVNGIGLATSRFAHYRQCGGILTYDPVVASLIGGYPKGAVLEYWDGTVYRRVSSLLEDNLYNFVESPAYIDGIHWCYADSWKPVPAIYLDPSRAETLEVVGGATVQWTTEKMYDPFLGIKAGRKVYVEVEGVAKSSWIRINHDSFVVIRGEFEDYTGYATTLILGYRLMNTDGRLNTYAFTNDNGDEITSDIYYLEANVPISKNYYVLGLGSGVAGQYMKAGSMVQLVYNSKYTTGAKFYITVARLKR